MQFFKSEFFIWLWTVPAVIFIFYLAKNIWTRRMKKFGDIVTLQTKLVPQHRKAYWSRRGFYLGLVFLLSVLALARPQWGEEKKKVERKGVDIIFMLDTSLSMLAEDVKPSRLEKSKIEIKSFVHRLEGDRVGMLAFAGSGFLQAPLTLDYAAFFLFLDAVDTGYIPDPGTSLSRALNLAVKSFPEESMKHKAIILFTDGEDHEGGLEPAVQSAKEAGVRVYAIGVGTEQGEPIPLKDESGRRTGYKKSRDGQVVITKLNKTPLEEIAGETGGIYLPSTAAEQEVELVLRHLATLGKRTYQERLVTEKEDHFQLFLILAFLCLLADIFVRRTRRLKSGGEFLGMLLLFLLTTGFLDTKASLSNEGEKQFSEKKFESALESYRKAQVKDPDDPYVLYNLASTLYKVQEYQEAERHLKNAIEKTQDDELKAKALYNYGNTLYRLGNFEEAIESYKKALELNPEDEDSKFNLEFLQKSKNRFEKQDQDRQKESQKQQQQQQQNQKDQQQQQQQQPQQKQDQNQQDQQQPQQQKDNQDQQEEPQEGERQGDQESKKPDEGEDQDKGGNQEEPQKDQQNPDEGQGEQPQQPDPQGPQEQNARPEPKPGDMPQPQSEEQQKPSGGGQEQRPLQGQMTQQNALKILDALKESEEQLQDLRRPPQPPQERMVLKDW